MDEFVIVLYAEERGVYVDDSPMPAGRTHRKFSVNPGVHSFRLDGVPDYAPDQITVAVQGTSWLLPKIITFRPKGTV